MSMVSTEDEIPCDSKWPLKLWFTFVYVMDITQSDTSRHDPYSLLSLVEVEVLRLLLKCCWSLWTIEWFTNSPVSLWNTVKHKVPVEEHTWSQMNVETIHIINHSYYVLIDMIYSACWCCVYKISVTLLTPKMKIMPHTLELGSTSTHHEADVSQFFFLFKIQPHGHRIDPHLFLLPLFNFSMLFFLFTCPP